MRIRIFIMMSVLSAGLLTSCDDDPAPTTPSTPSTSSPSSSPSSPATPAPSANRPPGPVTVEYQPKGTVLAGGTAVTFGAFVTDPDGDPLSYRWDFQDEEITTTSGGLAHTFTRARDYRVRVTVSDGKGGTSSGEVQVTAGTLDGAWTVENAVHENLTAFISHSGSASISGRFTNGATFTGNVGDPFRVVIRLDAPNSYCLQTGTYVGSADAGLNFVDVPGGGCRGFQLRRR